MRTTGILAEDVRQFEIRTEQEETVEKKAIDLYGELVVLNLIHNGGILLGDRRKKKNIRLEKALRKYVNTKEN